MIRVLIGLAGIVCALWAPWWTTLVIIAILSVLYSAWEVPLIGLVADLVWRPALGPIEPFPVLLVFALVLAWVAEPLRRRFFVR